MILCRKKIKTTFRKSQKHLTFLKISQYLNICILFKVISGCLKIQFLYFCTFDKCKLIDLPFKNMWEKQTFTNTPLTSFLWPASCENFFQKNILLRHLNIYRQQFFLFKHKKIRYCLMMALKNISIQFFTF